MELIEEDYGLLTRAREATTGANVHTMANLIAHYRNEIFIVNQRREKGQAEDDSIVVKYKERLENYLNTGKVD